MYYFIQFFIIFKYEFLLLIIYRCLMTYMIEFCSDQFLFVSLLSISVKYLYKWMKCKIDCYNKTQKGISINKGTSLFNFIFSWIFTDTSKKFRREGRLTFWEKCFKASKIWRLLKYFARATKSLIKALSLLSLSLYLVHKSHN